MAAYSLNKVINIMNWLNILEKSIEDYGCVNVEGVPEYIIETMIDKGFNIVDHKTADNLIIKILIKL